MGVITSLLLLFMYLYTLKKYPYIATNKLFFIFYSIFVFRLLLSFNHSVSFKPIVAGQSLNSLFSILTVFLLFSLIKKTNLKSKTLIPFYLIIVGVLISTMNSWLVLGGAVVIMKWLLLVLIVLSLKEIFDNFGIIKAIKPFYSIFLVILLSQLLSLLLGQGKDTESLVSSSNSISYIAGYAHESAFSMLLFMGMLISIILVKYRQVASYMPFVFFIAIVFANYRTTLISAFFPLVAAYIAFYFVNTKKESKTYFFLGASIFTFLICIFFGSGFIERFGELGAAFNNINELFEIDYSLFTVEERRLLSSRIYLWNMYLTEFSYFPVNELVFGRGPESWAMYFEVYAHNSFVGTLFDLGYVGLFLIFILFLKSFLLTLKINDLRIKIIMASNLSGFFIMANSTMPLWAVEGIYLFSFIFALSYFHTKKHNEK